MRIAIVHSFYDPREPSGENAVVEAQLALLREAGHDVTLVGRHTADLRHRQLYPLEAAVAAAGGPGYDPSDDLSDIAPDVVHVHNLFPNFGTSWLRAWGPRTIATLHNYRTVCANGLLWRDGHDCQECLDHGTHRAVEHACYRSSRVATLPLAIASRRHGVHQPVLRQTAGIITLNEHACRLFTPLAAGRVEIVPNFVAAPPKFHGVVNDRLLFVGRLTEEKGILRLLESLPDNVGLDILGSGPLEDEVARRCDGVITKYHGQQPPEEVRRFMASALALVLPSLWAEGIPTTALEAMSVGTPIVVSDHVAAAYDLTSGGAGVIYSPADPMSIGDAVTRILDARTNYSVDAEKTYADKYSPQAWLNAMERIYREVSSRT